MQHNHPHTQTHTQSQHSAKHKKHEHTFLEEHLIFLTFDISQVFRLEHMKLRKEKKKRNTSEEMSLLKNASILLLSIVEPYFLGAVPLLQAQELVFFPPSEDSDRTCVFLGA